MSALRSAKLTRALLSLIVLVVLSFTVYSLRLSDAAFTSGSSNQPNVFIAGTFGHINNKNGTLLLSMSGMKPGSSVSDNKLTLTGTGNLSGDYTMDVVNIVDTPLTSPLSGTLYVSLEDNATGDVLCDDPVSDLDPVDLGTIAPGQVNSYTITLYYPDGPTDGSVQGATMTATLRFTGVSQ